MQCENAEPDLLDIVKDTSRPITPEEEEALLDIDWESKPNLKPPFAYATLIYMALRDTDKDKLALSEIYEYIMNDFAYYRDCDPGWKNSVRHNLTQEPCFQKVDREPGDRGKGGYWRLNPCFRDHDILAAKRRRKFRKKRSGTSPKRTASGQSDSSTAQSEPKTGKESRSASAKASKALGTSSKANKSSKAGLSSPKQKLRRQKALRDASQNAQAMKSVSQIASETFAASPKSPKHKVEQQLTRRDSGVKSPQTSRHDGSLLHLGGFQSTDIGGLVSNEDRRFIGSFDSGTLSPPPFITPQRKFLDDTPEDLALIGAPCVLHEPLEVVTDGTDELLEHLSSFMDIGEDEKPDLIHLECTLDPSSISPLSTRPTTPAKGVEMPWNRPQRDSPGM